MKYFKPTNWSIDHKVPIYILMFTITVLGIISYISIPKEQMPDIVIPTIIVQTIYAGTSPTDIENLVTRQIEKQLKSVSGIKKVTSQSLPDVSVIIVEFQTNVDPSVAKQRVTDAVDKSRSDLPTDLTSDPMVKEIDFSEFPIMTLNIAGDLEPGRLNVYAEEMQDKIETYPEITRVDIIGAPEREFQVDLDMFTMQASGLTFDDVMRAIQFENVNISAGEFTSGGVRRDLRLNAQLKKLDDIKNIIVKTSRGAPLYLRDIAEVRDGYKEQQSFARLNGKPVIALSVIKKSGQNLIDASDKINAFVQEFTASRLPKGVTVTVTGDMSVYTRTTLSDLVNSIIIGFILVVLVLMFFLGVQDSIFIALAVPLSSFLAFIVIPGFGFTFNMIVMFSFLLALGIIVDDAIVVIENTHRIYTKQNLPIKEAARQAAGEVFVPVLTGTMTTIAPFFPLLFFPGISGKFMFYLPVVLILTLSASLVVAYIINPVLAAEYMGRKTNPRRQDKKMLRFSIVLFVFGILFHLASYPGAGNFLFLMIALGLLNRYFITPILIKGFQEKIQPLMMLSYRKTLEFSLKGRNPYYILGAMFAMLIVVIMLFAAFPPKVNFFPETDPDNVYVYIKMPIGTDGTVTDSVTKEIEKKIFKLFEDERHIVKSVITNVGLGAGDPRSPDRTTMPHKGKVSVNFVDFEHREGVSTKKYLEILRKEIKNLPGVEILVDKDASGPPTGKPVNIEISGDHLETLSQIENQIRMAIEKSGIQGIEKLNSDLTLNKPEIRLEINRARANAEGISSAQVGLALRTAVYGREASKLRDDKDDYPIQVRLEEHHRKDLNAILNMPISFREMSTGQFRQIPISAFVNISYVNTYASINHKNQKRTITLYSNVLTGYNTAQINRELEALVAGLDIPKDYEVKLTGEKEDQMEASAFLGKAFLIAIAMIMVILVTQFNSISKPLIIIFQVVLSLIGVFVGFLIFRFTFSVVITGVGIVALAGIVVRNGIVLIDFIELFHAEERGSIRKAIIHGGATRFNPVVLTALATTLGLVPLAFGFNINFVTLLSHFQPNIFIGGFSAALWGPLAWAIIFGLLFATFLTLVVVPCIYFINYSWELKRARKKELKLYRHALEDAKYQDK